VGLEKEPYGRAKTPIYKKRILEVLRKAERPLYVAEIQRRAEIKDWNSAKNIVYRLVSEGLVKAMDTERETVFTIAEPKDVSYWSPIPEIARLFEKPEPKVKVKLLKDGALLFEKGDKKYETNPANWSELTKKYTLESIVQGLEKGLQERGFPVKQGELLPEMKRVLKK
jgi:predicted transcriptional regulator